MLEKNTVLVRNRIDDELAKLHHKRQKQLNMLLIKYNKCKMLINNINAKEMIEQKQNKRFFLLKNQIPQINYSDYDQFKEDVGLNKKLPSEFNASVQMKQKEMNLENDNTSQKTVTKKLRSRTSNK